MARLLIAIGIALVVAGVVWPWISRLGLGRLPGDIVITRGHTRLYFPIVSSIIVSAVISLILWLLRK